jgi:hypothetical protein
MRKTPAIASSKFMRKWIVNSFGIFIALSPLAHAGHEVPNGGDICEDRFKIVRDDIKSWIEEGGAASLVLPKNLSITDYKTKMLAEIAVAQVSCVDSNTQVDGAEKTCENFLDDKGTAQIICNRQRFMATDESDQYVLVHHEYAGLSGFEVNQGMSSQYSISNQITGALETQEMLKLVVNKRLDAGLETDLPAIEAIQLIAPGQTYSGIDPKTKRPCQATFDSFGGLDVTIKSLEGKSTEATPGVWFELRSNPTQVTTNLSGDLEHLELKVVAQYATTSGAKGDSDQETYTLLLAGKDGAPSSLQILVNSTVHGASPQTTIATCDIQ